MSVRRCRTRLAGASGGLPCGLGLTGFRGPPAKYPSSHVELVSCAPGVPVEGDRATVLHRRWIGGRSRLLRRLGYGRNCDARMGHDDRHSRPNTCPRDSRPERLLPRHPRPPRPSASRSPRWPRGSMRPPTSSSCCCVSSTSDAGWNHGFLSCAHWLHWRTGIDLGAAREKVRVAHALAALPRISATMQRGAISYAKVRALTRVATPDNEASLLDFAQAGTAAQTERLVRAWRRVDDVAAAAQEESRHLHRQLSTWVDDDGMVVIRGRLTPEVGAVVQRALEAAADRLFREAQGAPRAEQLADEVTPAQRRADALGLLAEAALTADLDRGSAGDRYQVVLHVEASTGMAAVERSVARPWRSTTARWTFPRKRRDAFPATPRWWRCAMTPRARCWTSGARPAPSRRQSGGRSRRATGAADSRAAPLAAATPITSSTGSMAARRASTTWCCSAAVIIGRSTRADSH